MGTRWLAWVLLFISLPFAVAKDKRPPAASADELAATTARGRALFEYDQAAWHASDALMATNPSQEGLGRYIARKTDTGWTVAFGHLSGTKDSFLIAYEVTTGNEPGKYSVKRIQPPRSDSGFFLAAAIAIEVALLDFRGQQRPYNAAVLPDGSGRLFVYMYPAQTKTGAIPLGGDVRYLMSTDGRSIIDKRQMHKTILETTRNSPGETVAGVHSHVLTDVPEDTDVFHAIMRRLPEFVGCGGRVYQVLADGSIKLTK